MDQSFGRTKSWGRYVLHDWEVHINIDVEGNRRSVLVLNNPAVAKGYSK